MHIVVHVEVHVHEFRIIYWHQLLKLTHTNANGNKYETLERRNPQFLLV